ncbi:uncharacterized protein M421DRAFT_154811 [Didymella exigua CBS 183.55]|uniref:Secreted protein n=1 Tax=Didymella exigua CBS 183.55 TaxID=1150837 RepID=A0A6A5RMW1_9PLEO|nr:uncharacterized protein M421DRAFT_154811 [Didymella exigua CBS 183.55]KAF1928773.1 hypothetical protein M421DRAFT_154811 [Didymella exigua CBS 183.55]
MIRRLHHRGIAVLCHLVLTWNLDVCVRMLKSTIRISKYTILAKGPKTNHPRSRHEHRNRNSFEHLECQHRQASTARLSCRGILQVLTNGIRCK